MSEVNCYPNVIGLSVNGEKQIVLSNFHFNEPIPPNLTFLIGGMHGDEVATIRLLDSFAEKFLKTGVVETPVAILSLANPDGYRAGTRYNANGVDLNRNFSFNWQPESEEPSGSAPWSEPESCALRDFILKFQPFKIVSLHWALAEIDADGAQSTDLACAMWNAVPENERVPYRIRVAELGHGMRRLEQTYTLCPGSLGQWCGYELDYVKGAPPAMITLELPYDSELKPRPDFLPEDHLENLHALWKRDADGYLKAVEPAVHQMLLAACCHRQAAFKPSI